MNTRIEQLIREKQGTIVDVRTTDEFRRGHVAGAVNIPLQELESRLAELNSLKMPLVLCCASGNRSGMATHLLSSKGLECYNGGSWMDVNSYQS